jgi:hypothetical protein
MKRRKTKKTVRRTRKQRTREHIIADQSFHYLAYRVVQCGFTVEAIRSDYGYDGSIWTIDERGQIENSSIYFQLKATDAISLSSDGSKVLFRISKRDIALWEDEFMPVYLIVFDTARELAYWVYLQKYLEAKKIRATDLPGETLLVEIGVSNLLTIKAIRGWRADKKESWLQ